MLFFKKKKKNMLEIYIVLNRKHGLVSIVIKRIVLFLFFVKHCRHLKKKFKFISIEMNDAKVFSFYCFLLIFVSVRLKSFKYKIR